jgi:hypothetical protein
MHIKWWTCYIISMPSGGLVPKWSSNHNITSVLGWQKSTANIRTVNKLPQAKCLLVLEQNLDLASVDLGLHDVITRQVPAHNLHALLANLKRLVREKLGLTLPVELLAFHLAFRGWKVEWILTLHLLLFFYGSYLGVFKNLAKRDKVPRMVPSIAQVVFVTSPKALCEPQLPTSMSCMWSFG